MGTELTVSHTGSTSVLGVGSCLAIFCKKKEKKEKKETIVFMEKNRSYGEHY